MSGKPSRGIGQLGCLWNHSLTTGRGWQRVVAWLNGQWCEWACRTLYVATRVGYSVVREEVLIGSYKWCPLVGLIRMTSLPKYLAGNENACTLVEQWALQRS